MERKRIVITGIGVLTPIGSGKEVFWENLCQGKVGTEEEVTAFNTEKFDCHIGGEVRDIDPEQFFEKNAPSLVGRTTQLAVAAAKMAVKDANIPDFCANADRVSVCMGTTMGNNSVIEKYHENSLTSEQEASTEYMTNYSLNRLSSVVAEELGAEGTCMVVPTACAAGNYAIGLGKDLIEEGKADKAIVGGADAMSRVIYTTFSRLGAMAQSASKPFDKNRDGINVSEGAGVLVLEDYEKAKQRGARIYAELLGHGLACDAHHPTAPHPEGEGAEQAIKKALIDAGISVEDVSYINAHGTGTKANDQTESMAIKNVFGPYADQVPVSSVKSMLGHTMGAASAIEAIVCTLSIYHSLIPPTMNIEVLDEECLSSVVVKEPIAKPVKFAISNSFAFGGNISIISLGSV
ncbi:beta-ketoacyl-[acyl-carrier-protein] synthase family protein [Halalkalibacterium halodurans]|uniref:beta-ketoacyl-[acyl-carrier-protein] synthase family protein n=1 Tax=Halalkalibacterium halodurans TaxID=86665 RepID=UPI001067D616|nr:beta-ketoacyl-[acyl-carrier-protein] synthase family protein [Halalkalibacterium halodurans]TES55754.1 beta-ketoacyl-[acyl-carrier-protein] synthase family protein [Halalkalibacterium halodurans]